MLQIEAKCLKSVLCLDICFAELSSFLLLQILALKREYGKLLYASNKTREAVEVFCTLTYDQLMAFYNQPTQRDAGQLDGCKELTSR